MDVVKPKKSKTFYLGKTGLILIISISITAVLLWQLKAQLHEVSFNKSELLIAEVQQGGFEVVVNGFGELFSDRKKILTAFSSGMVTEILIKAGTQVTEGDVIFKMINPELGEAKKSELKKLEVEHGHLRKLKVEHKINMLSEVSDLRALEGELVIAQVKLRSKKLLKEKGIISEFEFLEAELIEKQLSNKIELSKEKIEQILLIQQETLNIQLVEINQQQDRVNTAKRLHDLLNVTASRSGTLQALNIELGSNVKVGENIGVIGSNDELIARVQVSQAQASNISVGDKATVIIWPQRFSAVVKRVDPIVTDQQVFVDIDLLDRLPKSIKPNQELSAEIITASLHDTLYISRPANIQNNQMKLYKLSPAMNSAQQIDITLGQIGSQRAQVLKGARAGERFIISDLSYVNSPRIIIN